MAEASPWPCVRRSLAVRLCAWPAAGRSGVRRRDSVGGLVCGQQRACRSLHLGQDGLVFVVILPRSARSRAADDPTHPKPQPSGAGPGRREARRAWECPSSVNAPSGLPRCSSRPVRVVVQRGSTGLRRAGRFGGLRAARVRRRRVGRSASSAGVSPELAGGGGLAGGAVARGAAWGGPGRLPACRSTRCRAGRGLRRSAGAGRRRPRGEVRRGRRPHPGR